MADDEIIKKHTKAAYKVWKAPNMSLKHKFQEILLEIAIIVFAVSVSIWFHNWSESLHNKKEEKEFLASLKKDLIEDKSEMLSDKNSFIQGLQGLSYFKKVGEGLALNKDSLNKYQWIFFASGQINPRISRYETLKSSGKLDIVENKELLKNITDLYQKNFPLIFRQNQSFNELRENFITPFIEDHLQLDSHSEGTNWQDVLRISKMRVLLLQGSSLNNNIKSYSDGIDKINEIIAQIETDVK